jgi:3-hydroxyacyl-CoA dehydrogenase
MVGAMAKNYPAPMKCLEAVQASVKRNFTEGIALEHKLFGELYLSVESRALRHLFKAERDARKIAGVCEDTRRRKIESVAVIGAGTMGRGIAIAFITSGIPVVILDAAQDKLDSALTAIRKTFEGQVAKRKLRSEKAAKLMAMLTTSLAYEDIEDADLVIEAAFEDLTVKEAIFRKLDAHCKAGAILASNTSTLDLNKIAAFTKRPQDVIGAHFFSPANVMKLLEVIRGEQTSVEVLATMMDLAHKIKKTAVLSGVCDGFIGNRMVNQYVLQAMLLLNEGGSVQQIDGALEEFGMAMGPFKMSDLAGNDIGWAIRKRHYAQNPAMARWTIADRLCEMGRFGQKSGLGWYRYEDGRRDASLDPLVDEEVTQARKELGIVARAISNEEIVQRCIYALVNEGARILDEGIAQRASDIDLVYIYGYGFPIHRGGPMLYADCVGLFSVARTVTQFAASAGPATASWEPARLLTTLASQGKTFN